MAITKILNIMESEGRNPASHLKNALEYIQNPDKTEECVLVGGINCLPDTAFEQMEETKNIFHKTGKRQGYHVIISFSPEEKVTAEQAMYVLEHFAKDVLGDDYPEIFQTSSGKSVGLLSWSHYAALLQVKDEEARDWYEKEAAEQTWSVRTLQRNISSQYYYRMLGTQKKELVESEMKELTAPYQNDKLEFIKNPVVAEFLGFSQNTDFTESDLEKSILSNLQKFLMELGKGYAFVARQQHIHTEKQDYYIDLVFYNYILKCFVLIDLKTEKITHQDVGQMDMYIRMYDELKRSEGDNPTIGIVLCSDTDDDIARYSVMHGNEQLFASKYKLYLPTKEELKAEIETQKAMFYLQQQDNEEKKIE